VAVIGVAAAANIVFTTGDISLTVSAEFIAFPASAAIAALLALGKFAGDDLLARVAAVLPADAIPPIVAAQTSAPTTRLLRLLILLTICLSYVGVL
jgi:hypothetical protein